VLTERSRNCSAGAWHSTVNYLPGTCAKRKSTSVLSLSMDLLQSNLTQMSTAASFKALPTALTTACNPGAMPSIPFDTITNFSAGTSYCQVNFPYHLDRLQYCCGGGEVQLWQNCTQFCKTDRTLEKFSFCVKQAINDIRYDPDPLGTLCGKTSGQERNSRVSLFSSVLVTLAVLTIVY
jgi:hypothetical protein